MKDSPESSEAGYSPVGRQLYDLIVDLYPICRSITGDGVRETLTRIARIIPLSRHEVPSGTQVFDWTVPKEWNIREAWVRNSGGERIIDFEKNNLHVLSYSTPLHRFMSLADLRRHLYTLPDCPDWIPYRTSYYEERWGFCISQNQLDRLPEDEYEVYIDSTLEVGMLSYAEVLIPGKSVEEVLVSCHVCHPSLANDNLSGVAVAAFAARALQTRAKLRYSYRFLFIPGTIGAITWLAQNQSRVGNIKHGLVLAGVGDAGPLTYKRSRRGNARIDRAAARVLGQLEGTRIYDFSPLGYDERQYCSPGLNLPMGRLSRTPYTEIPEYHTSADNLDFVHPRQLEDALKACLDIFDELENERLFRSLKPNCEPHLSKYGLYDSAGGNRDGARVHIALQWVLNYCDGQHSLQDIAEQAGLDLTDVESAVQALLSNGLLEQIN